MLSDLKKMEAKGLKERMRDREQWRLDVEEGQGSTRAVAPTGRQMISHILQTTENMT
jgi:hypothetical protein